MSNWFKRQKLAMPNSDRWVDDPSGQKFWGKRGAGLLFVRNHPQLGPQMQLCLRAEWTDQGGTWSGTGGAIGSKEDPYKAALRETVEEIGSVPFHKVIQNYTWQVPGGNFTFTTFICQIEDMNWQGSPSNEVVAVKWVNMKDAMKFSLHSGVRDMLSQLGKGVFGNQEGKPPAATEQKDVTEENGGIF